MKRAVYPGSFDPVTNGHLDIIERLVPLFDEVIVAVVVNPDKAPLFPLESRIEFLRSALKSIPRVAIDHFEGLLVDYAKKINANVIVLGLRAVSDFEYEFQMALFNRRMNPSVETVFMMTDYRYTFLSSSLVKQIALRHGDIHGLVPDGVETALKSIAVGGKQ